MTAPEPVRVCTNCGQRERFEPTLMCGCITAPSNTQCECLGCQLEALAHHCAKRRGQADPDTPLFTSLSRLDKFMKESGLRISDAAPGCFGSGLICQSLNKRG